MNDKARQPVMEALTRDAGALQQNHKKVLILSNSPTKIR